jgi:hypothetical protein
VVLGLRQTLERQMKNGLVIRSLLLALAAATVGCGDDATENTGGADADAGKDAGDKSSGNADAGDKPAPESDAGVKPDSDAEVVDGSVAQSDAGEAADAGAKIFGFIREAEGSSFVTLTNEILPDDSPEVASGREIDGWTLFAGGNAITALGSEVQQWKVNDDLTLSKGPALSFAQFPLNEGEVNFFYQFEADTRHLYLPFDLTSRVIYDPVDMKVVGTREDSQIPTTLEGLRLEGAGNRTMMKAKGQPVQMAYFFRDDDWWKFASKSIIALYDPETHEESKLVEIGCPGLAVSSRDEEGYTYWSTWDYKGIVAAYGMGPWPCVARLTPDGELDESFTTDLRDLTGGLSHRMFQYVRNGWAVMLVWDHKSSAIDFDNPQPDDDASEKWWNDSLWSIWKVDLKTMKAAPLEGIEGEINAEIYIEYVDDKIFFNVPYEKWEKMRRYELNDDDTVKLLPEPKGNWHFVR